MEIVPFNISIIFSHLKELVDTLLDNSSLQEKQLCVFCYFLLFFYMQPIVPLGFLEVMMVDGPNPLVIKVNYIGSVSSKEWFSSCTIGGLPFVDGDLLCSVGVLLLEA